MQSPRREDLWKILRAGKQGARYAQGAGVALQRGGGEVDDEEGNDEGEEGIDAACRSNENSGFVGRLRRRVRRRRFHGACSREEEEEEKEST